MNMIQLEQTKSHYLLTIPQALMTRAKKIKPRQWDPRGLVWKYPRNKDTYELLIDDLRDYRFYADDMTHPSDMAIEYVWDKFSSAYFDQATIGLNKRIEKINKSINHKPFNKNSEEYVGFLKKLYTEISMIQNQLPLDTFNSEVTYINKHIL